MHHHAVNRVINSDPLIDSIIKGCTSRRPQKWLICDRMRKEVKREALKKGGRRSGCFRIEEGAVSDPFIDCLSCFGSIIMAAIQGPKARLDCDMNARWLKVWIS